MKKFYRMSGFVALAALITVVPAFAGGEGQQRGSATSSFTFPMKRSKILHAILI